MEYLHSSATPASSIISSGVGSAAAASGEPESGLKSSRVLNKNKSKHNKIPLNKFFKKYI